MLNFAYISFFICGISFFILSILLLTYWKDRQHSQWLFLSAFVTALWSFSLFLQTMGFFDIQAVWVLETLRYFLWINLLLFYLKGLYQKEYQPYHFIRNWQIFILLLSFISILPWQKLPTAYVILIGNPRYLLFIIFTISGLILIEQLFRNIRRDSRWGIKYLCLGLACFFAYDLYLYAEAVSFARMNATLWYTRGLANTLVVPLVVITLCRNPKAIIPVYISRKIIFYSTLLMISGSLLIGLFFVSFYIRQFGGTFSAIIQIIFICISLIFTLAFISSGSVRTRIKIILNKYFFFSQYDYREEWLKLMHLLSGNNNNQPLAERSIQALANIVDSTGGHVILINKHQHLESIGQLNTQPIMIDTLDPLNKKLMALLSQSRTLINLAPINGKNNDKNQLPAWILNINDAWLIIPLMVEQHFLGFMILLKPRTTLILNQENHRLLSISSQQAASYLAFEQSATALAESQQFEGFNRLSAFVIHDLKNMIAQLSLVSKNAVKHIDNPDFIDDAFKTIDNSVSRMNRLLRQLNSLNETQPAIKISLKTLLAELVDAKKDQPIKLIFLDKVATDIYLEANYDRLYSVLGHIVQNAQDASNEDTEIKMILEQTADRAIIKIIDQGEGMTADFVKNQLFKPFYSSKGLTGMGIGAYESKEYIQQLGGQLNVESELKKGTTFSINLVIN